MAHFQYRLQTLLDQKVKAKDDAQHALAKAQRELRIEHEELEACHREQETREDRLRSERMESVANKTAGMSGETLVLKRNYLARLQDECHDASDATGAQEVRVNEAADCVTKAQEALASASRAVQVLEKHRARLERRFHLEAERKEALDQDEMATAIFLQRSEVT